VFSPLAASARENEFALFIAENTFMGVALSTHSLPKRGVTPTQARGDSCSGLACPFLANETSKVATTRIGVLQFRIGQTRNSQI
jgi:hypothetical protein